MRLLQPVSDMAAVCCWLQYYHYVKFQHDFGLVVWKTVTDTLTAANPDANVGANFSPGDDYTCATFQFIRSFREDAMTLPWGETWIFCFVFPHVFQRWLLLLPVLGISSRSY